MAVSETPPFWFEKPGIKAWLLAPFSLLYSRAAAIRMRAKPSGSVDAPVLCIGNFIAGGGGKTPTALKLADEASAAGLTPGFLSRGYGGRISGPQLVDLKIHNASDVGDEPILLARSQKTVISADRVAGANLLIENGCDFIIMDDGFQNRKLRKDYSLIVVDSRRGIGNGFAMPAGPLRVRMGEQLPKADSVLIVGDGDAAIKVVRLAARAGKPVYHALTKLVDGDQWNGKSLLAFCAIADPQKFYDSLVTAGGHLAMVKSYPDHHFFSRDDIMELLDRAKLLNAKLVTTSKDFVRLLNMGEAEERLARETAVSNIVLEFTDDGSPESIISKTLSRYEKRNRKKLKSHRIL